MTGLREQHLTWAQGQLQKIAEAKTEPHVNPCVQAYGHGPEGSRCKTCSHLVERRMGRVYLKCGYRKITRGKATDHRAGWHACAKYQERTGPERDRI